jgi:uncharacterized protein
VQNLTPAAIAVFSLELVPALLFGLAGEKVTRKVALWPRSVRLAVPVLFVLPYVIIATAWHVFHWEWFALYVTLPVGVAWLLDRAVRADPEQRGSWYDLIILLTLGLAVDLRWLESAWPQNLEALGKILLVDVGLYGFLAIRQLTGAGFDFRLRSGDWKTGLRELLLFTPPVLVLGLALGFIHPHSNLPQVGSALFRWIAIFFFVALPEELFFRGWVQNFLERRFGKTAALLIASVVFGLSHFNKRLSVGMPHFNWRYVMLATIAGIFYGRAWRDRHRLPASAITHTFVDWIWSWWF